MTARRVPVLVLAGFLGSGKTTLLNHLLRRSRGTRIGAVVNDFGSIEIDAMAVSGQVDAMVSLGDGCLCCAVDTSELDDVLERLARPEARMDVLVVEASGLAEPETVIRMILASRSPHLRYAGLVEVVDAVEFPAALERHPELGRHVTAADLVVLNKTDRVGEDEAERLRTALQRRSGGPVVRASHGRVDPELLFDAPERERPAVQQLSFDEVLYGDGECEAAGAHDGHLHAAYRSVEFTAGEPLDPGALLAFLDARPVGLYRIKGIVDFGPADPGRRYSVHAVGGFLRFTPERWGTAEERATRLVLIGTDLDEERLLSGLRACVAEPDAAPGASALWGVLRHTDARLANGGEDPDWSAEFAEPPELDAPAP
ncbi:CobW family GTP-binding protein [Streptomyces sulphureus]|uniref:CobW family GTP-binding protein n=1 Tax=Streptomyces sulphureus TaxID=47758 RepID=UPI00036C9DD5|nr:GTP-binding protein [Streptomyces sulphureus]